MFTASALADFFALQAVVGLALFAVVIVAIAHGLLRERRPREQMRLSNRSHH